MHPSQFLEFIEHIINSRFDQVDELLQVDVSLATTASSVGASRQNASEFFFPQISMYLNVKDTPLHMAAAAGSLPIVKLLLKHGADCRAKNRLGMEPLHHASQSTRNNSSDQDKVISLLVSHGACVDACDKSGVTPLLKAVRARSFTAVKALLKAGADPRKPNKSGSTPLHLAVQNTGASGSGTEIAKSRQSKIIALLLEKGAKSSDRDAKGKSVRESTRSDWILELLHGNS